MEAWDLILESWVTMDWGYDDVACGDVIESPLFISLDSMMVPTQETHKRIERLDGNPRRYRIVAEVTAVWDRHWAIDFGLSATTAAPLSADVIRGTYVTGDVDLGIDYPTDWQGYRWLVESITKVVSEQEQNSRMEVERTDGYHDHGMTYYVLHCQKLESQGMTNEAPGGCAEAAKIDPVYEIWDSDAAHPIIEYDDLSEALAFIATTVERRGDAAVLSWSLLRALPNGDETETIAVGADLVRLARAPHHAVSA